MKTIILQCFWKNIILLKYIETYCRNFDQEDYDKECINLFLETLQ